MHNFNSLKTDSLCNSFFLTDSDIDELQWMNQIFNLVQIGTSTISVADDDTMFSVTINLPMAQTSLSCIHTQEALWHSLLLPGYLAILFISEHDKLIRA